MRVDVAIVGSGTAGAAAALQLARRGFRVVCLDRRPLSEAGARWVNGVPRWMFAEAGIPEPQGAELRGAGHPFHLVAGFEGARLVVREHETLDVDMRLLVSRLQRLALEAGAELFGETHVHGLDGQRLSTSRGEYLADVVVDASGLAGANLTAQPRIDKRDVCVAAQEVREVTDRSAAEAFFRERGAEPGDTLCFTGVAGGYSIVNARLDHEGVSLLTGSIPGMGQPSGRALLERFVERSGFIGRTLFGGARSIPLGRPRARLSKGRVVLLGDAALQVFSAHGSGIGAGMVAARVLADSLVRSAGDLHEYSLAWHRRYGGELAAYDVFRRFSQTLSVDDIEGLMNAGVMDAESARAALSQKLPEPPPPGELVRLARALVGQGRLAVRLAGVAPRLALALLIHARYPRRARDVDAWARRADLLLG